MAQHFRYLAPLKRKDFFVMENVQRLFNHNKNKTREEILSMFNKIGYHVECDVLNSPLQKKNNILIKQRLAQ